MPTQLERRSTLVDAVEARIQRGILDGEFTAGQPLPPGTRLARELGVSVITLRRATSRLEARGLLEASRGRQTRVSALGRFVTFDALVTTVLLAPADGGSEELLIGLLELRRHLYAALLVLACERSENLQALKACCLEVACRGRWERDVLGTASLELQLLAVAAKDARNVTFLHALGSLHRLFERLPTAWLQGRSCDAIDRRMRRTEELLESRNSQELGRFTLAALEAEDAACMAALSASKR